MNFLQFFDRTTVAILLPSIVFYALVIACAVRKGCLPWPTRERSNLNLPIAAMLLFPDHKFKSLLSPPQTQAMCDVSTALRSLKQSWPSQMVLYFISISAGTVLFSWSTNSIFAGSFVNPLKQSLGQIFSPMALSLIFSLLATLPISCALQIHYFRKIESLTLVETLRNCRFFVSLGLLFSLMMLVLPLIQCILASYGAIPIDQVAIAQLLCYSPALTAPLSLSSLCIVVLSNLKEVLAFRRDAQYVCNPALSMADLSQKSDSELHSLIDAALALQNTDHADMISKLLLERAGERTFDG
jgi:hypothetical protein